MMSIIIGKKVTTFDGYTEVLINKTTIIEKSGFRGKNWEKKIKELAEPPKMVAVCIYEEGVRKKIVVEGKTLYDQEAEKWYAANGGGENDFYAAAVGGMRYTGFVK